VSGNQGEGCVQFWLGGRQRWFCDYAVSVAGIEMGGVPMSKGGYGDWGGLWKQVGYG